MTDQLAKLRESFGIDERLRTAEKKYNPDQPRHPEGDPRGGQWAAQGGAAGANDKPMPSQDDLLPDWLYKTNPKLFENTIGGCQVGSGGRGGWMDTVRANDPYEAMKWFARSYGGEVRTAERIFGNTPVNRFLFRLAGGEKTYEVEIERFPNRGVGDYYIYESSPRWSRGRGKDKVPFWSDLV